MGKKIRVKMEVRQYIENIIWIDEEIEIPDGEEDIEDYLKNEMSAHDFDTSNNQETVRDEERTIELIEELEGE